MAETINRLLKWLAINFLSIDYSINRLIVAALAPTAGVLHIFGLNQLL